jgi:hypothetical protein
MNSALINLLDVIAKHSDAHTMAAKAMPLFVGHMGADNGSLMLLADDRVVHKVLATKETFTAVSEHKVRTVLDGGLAGWSLRHRQGGLASDTEIDERWVSMGDSAIASALVVPMMSRSTVIGLLAFHHADRGYFREAHLARAAELAQLVSPLFDIALMTESSIASLAKLCQGAGYPSTVLDWHGNVKVVNKAMEELDIVWEGANFSQSLLPRELNVGSIRECDWDGMRRLTSLPYDAYATPFRGAGVWIQLAESAISTSQNA